MKKLRIPIPYKIVAIIKRKVPFTVPIFKVLRIFFENILVKSLLTVGFPIVFLIQGRVINFQKYDWHTKEFYIEIKPLLITAAIFVFLSFIMTAVERHAKYYIEMSKSYHDLLSKINVLQKDISTEINHLNRNINSNINFQNGNISKLNEVMDNNSIVERIGAFICNIIYDWLVELTEEKCFNVTYVQRFKNPITDEESIVMLAFKNEDEKQPSSFGIPIKLYTGGEQKYFHRNLFEQNANDMQILQNRTEIEDKFTELADNILDEDKTKQYVCFPIKVHKRTMMLFQISAYKGNSLGKNKGEIKNNMRLMLPIINMITPFYNKDFLMRELCCNVVKCFENRQVRGKKGKEV